MGKLRQIFIWDGTRDLGPFRRDELIEQLKIGTVLPSHFFFEEEMSDWARVATLPCCARFLASEAQKEMLTRMGIEYDEYLTKDDVSRILEHQPATERQLALIAYLGLRASPNMTKTEASEFIEAAKQNPLLVDRFDSWNFDRLELHGDMYATERKSFKEGRGEILWRQYQDFRSDLQESGARVRNLTLHEVNTLIAQLDATRPDWDRELYLNGLDHVLELLKDRI
jgi:hypothetical protein